MDSVMAAYIAGVMDGEGCFYIERFKTARSPIGFQYLPMATVTMCDKDTIDFICNATAKTPRLRNLKSGRTAFVIDWRNGACAALIRSIMPHLRGKKEQAQLCLHFHDVIAPGRGKSYAPGDGEACEAVRLRLQSLKKPTSLRC